MATQQSSQEGSSEPIDLCLFDYEELQKATNYFNPSQVIGEGGFGVVYRGELRNGRAVAIKELIVRHNNLVEQFLNEVKLLSRLRHKNLLSLYGHTNPEDEKMLLVYELVPNGTVADHLHLRRFSKMAFTWSQRLQIAIQTAEGLAYLHSLQPPVIHCDVKTDNILLDNSFNVKIADFGLSRLLPPSGTYLSTMPQGTQGYLDPEYNQFYKLTTKSDVYSFGVVLMELISGKAVLDYKERDGDEIWLARMALNKMKNNQLDQLVDLGLGYLEDTKIFSTVTSVAQLAYECLQSKRYMRPPMSEVLKSLKKISDAFISSGGDDEISLVNMASQEGPSKPSDLGLSSFFDYDELQEATKFFSPSEVVGKGGFGVVYRGKLRDGRTVAIKELTDRHMMRVEQFFNPLEVLGEGGFGVVNRGELRDGRAVAMKELPHRHMKRVEQFFNEVTVLSQLRHKNIITLYGCINPEEDKLFLVYEFMPNGTVANHLHLRWFSETVFTWSQRLQIAIQTAEGLAYLHSLQRPVIHCDVKTDNILLDNSFNVKVANFEQSHILPSSGTHISAMPMSTQGYLDPVLTTKSDVYSFGIVLMDLISGKAALDVDGDDDGLWLVNMALAKMKNDQIGELVDPELCYLDDPKIFSTVNSVAEVAYECLQPGGYRRPPMPEILKSLKKISDAFTSSGGDDEISLVNMASQKGPSKPSDLGLSSFFDYNELQEATKSFSHSEVVGKCGFGVVYRGKLRDGRAVAIKELTDRHMKRVEQFFNEVAVLSQLHHMNIITLYGCTNPEEKKLFLVYEFMPNGTVADHLHLKCFSETVLTWSQRLQIAIQTAEGLAYLHSHQRPVIHCDVKTDNILLDNSFNAKVASFDQSHILPSSGTHISAMPMGMQGYLDPEYNQHYILTTKSDVYSFGVVLMELISGKAAALNVGVDDRLWLVNMTLNKMKNDQLDQLVDPELGYLDDPKIFTTVNSVAELAYECLQPGGYMRPPMMEVFKSLMKINDDDDSSSSSSDDEIGLVSMASQKGPSESSDISRSSIFTFDELQEATKFFNPSEVVGEGGFGVVYRGKLRDGRAVAIKELTVRHNKRVEQFLNEVRLLSPLNHKNLVRLYDCTNPEFGKMLLVYEFMPNGTVADHLHHRRSSKKAFTWSQRLQIAIQTAEGLAYLHSFLPPVIHCDVKTNNILLDDNFNIKVADFGMSRLLPPSRTHISGISRLPPPSGAHISTMPQGTPGYLDPEHNQLYKLSTKSDVYSFGVVLMELISGKAVLDVKRDEDGIWLVRMAFNKMENDRLEDLVDPELGYLEDPKIANKVNSMAQLAYKCLQPTAYTRPPMVEVLKSLKEISDDGASTSSCGDDNAETSSSGIETLLGGQRGDLMNTSEDNAARLWWKLDDAEKFMRNLRCRGES